MVKEGYNFYVWIFPWDYVRVTKISFINHVKELDKLKNSNFSGDFSDFPNTDFSFKKAEKNTPYLERTSPRSASRWSTGRWSFLGWSPWRGERLGKVASSTGFFGRDLIQQIWVLRDFLILRKNEGLVFFFASWKMARWMEDVFFSQFWGVFLFFGSMLICWKFVGSEFQLISWSIRFFSAQNIPLFYGLFLHFSGEVDFWTFNL